MNLLFYLNSTLILRIVIMLFLLIWSTVADVGQDRRNANMSSYLWPYTDTYLASLRRQSRDLIGFGIGHICGGALISPIVVVTAAHCFANQAKYDGSFLSKSEFYVVLGSHYRYATTQDTMSIELKEVVIQQKRFDFKTYDKDIALIVLKRAVPLSMHPIKLFQQQVVTQSCQISGWSHIDDQTTDELLHFSVTLATDEECKLAGGNITHLMEPGMLCVFNKNEMESEACVADSGGPLICEGQLVGINTWGFKCGMPRLPAIYTNVLQYRNWITNSIVRKRRKQAKVNELVEPNNSYPIQVELHGSLYFIVIMLVWQN